MNSAWDSEVCGLTPARCVSQSGDRNGCEGWNPSVHRAGKPTRAPEGPSEQQCGVVHVKPGPRLQPRAGLGQPHLCREAAWYALWEEAGGRMPSAPGGLFVVEELLKVTEDPSPPNLENPIFPPLTFLRSWMPRTGRVPGWAGRAQVQDLQSSTRSAGSAPNR